METPSTMDFRAVGRTNPDGSLWQPTVNSRICSNHFVGNKKAEHPHSSSYNPTIFSPKTNKSTVPEEKAVGRNMDGIQERGGIKCIIKEEVDSEECVQMQKGETNRVTNFMRKNLRKKDDLRMNPEKEIIAKNTGKAYINCQGQVVPARSMKNMCMDSAKNPCHLVCGQRMFSEKKRLKVFQHFWNLSNRFLKYEFICRNIKLIVPKTRKPNPSTTKIRKYSRLYYLPIDGQVVRVCRTTFIATLGINEQWVNTALKKFGQVVSSENPLDKLENDLQIRSTDEKYIEECGKNFSLDDSDPHFFPQKNYDSMDEIQESEDTNCIIKEEVDLDECEWSQIEDETRAKEAEKANINRPEQLASVRSMKNFKKACENYCPYNCREIAEEQRKKICQDFWSICDTYEKYAYISRLVEQQHSSAVRKKIHRKYFLEISGEFRRVCLLTFLATLNISKTRVDTAISQLGTNSVVCFDGFTDTEIGPIL